MRPFGPGLRQVRSGAGTGGLAALLVVCFRPLPPPSIRHKGSWLGLRQATDWRPARASARVLEEALGGSAFPRGALRGVSTALGPGPAQHRPGGTAPEPSPAPHARVCPGRKLWALMCLRPRGRPALGEVFSAFQGRPTSADPQPPSA